MKTKAVKNPTFALSYETLQEIHTLTGMVCGWHMSLPKVMIGQAKKVHGLMLGLRWVSHTKKGRR